MIDLSKIREALDAFDAVNNFQDLEVARELLRMACDRDTIAALVAAYNDSY